MNIWFHNIHASVGFTFHLYPLCCSVVYISCFFHQPTYDFYTISPCLKFLFQITFAIQIGSCLFHQETFFRIDRTLIKSSLARSTGDFNFHIIAWSVKRHGNSLIFPFHSYSCISLKLPFRTGQLPGASAKNEFFLTISVGNTTISFFSVHCDHSGIFQRIPGFIFNLNSDCTFCINNNRNFLFFAIYSYGSLSFQAVSGSCNLKSIVSVFQINFCFSIFVSNSRVIQYILFLRINSRDIGTCYRIAAFIGYGYSHFVSRSMKFHIHFQIYEYFCAEFLFQITTVDLDIVSSADQLEIRLATAICRSFGHFSFAVCGSDFCPTLGNAFFVFDIVSDGINTLIHLYRIRRFFTGNSKFFFCGKGVFVKYRFIIP